MKGISNEKEIVMASSENGGDYSGLALLGGIMLGVMLVIALLFYRLPGINYADIEPAAGTPSYSSTTTRSITTTPNAGNDAAAPETTTVSRTRTETTNR